MVNANAAAAALLLLLLLMLLLKACILLRKLQIYEPHDKFVSPRSLKNQLYLREPLDRIQYLSLSNYIFF